MKISQIISMENMKQQIIKLENDYDNLKSDLDKREKDLILKHENYKTKIGQLMNLLVIQNNKQNDSITQMYTVVSEIVPIITNSLKSINMCAEKIMKSTKDIKVKN